MKKEVLEQYILDGLNKGYSEEQLREIIVKSGVNEKEVDEAMEEIKSGGERKRKTSAKKIILVAIFLVVMVLLLGLLTFWIFRGLSNEETTLPAESLRGGESFEECNNFTEEKNIVFCKIMASYRAGNAEYCEENLNENLFYRYGRNESYPLLSSKDFCWMTFASKNNSYCDNIKDSNAKQRCVDEIA